jgi:signal transduction histidine kinase
MASPPLAPASAGRAIYRRFDELIWVCMGGYVAYALFYAVGLHQYLIAAVLALPALLLFALFNVLRSGWPERRVRLSAHGLLVANMAALCLSLIWGGLPPSTTIWWLVWWPLFVTHMLGVRDGLLWSLIATACAVLIWLNHGLGYIQPLMPGDDNPVFMMQLGFLMMGGSVGLVVRRAYDRYERDIQAQQTQIAEQNLALAQRADKLEAMLQAVQQSSLDRTRLFAQLSHEVRTPLNGLLGFAQLLGQTPLSALQASHLAQVHACGQALLHVVGEVLDFSRLEVQSTPLDARPFDAVQLAHEAADMVWPIAMQKGVALTRDLPADEIQAVGDPLRVRQVLLNLLANAVKFTPSGEVAVRCRLQPFEDGQRALYVEVQDSGIGISPQAMAHLFQPFSKASDHTMAQFGGSGLGLAICKRLVDMMDGHIGVRSQPGAGSLFWFHVPIKLAHSSELVPAQAA